MASAKEKRRSARPDVQAIANKARDKIAKLTEYARAGDFQAALELYRATNLGVGFLTLLHTMNPEIIRKVAQDHKAWPVLFSPHRDSIEENKGFVEAIGLGCETGSSFAARGAASARVNPAIGVVQDLHVMAATLIRLPKKEWTFREWLPFGPVTRFKYEPDRWRALEAWGQTGVGSRLPRLAKSTAREWAAATVELFDLVYRDNFDEHPDLQELRDHHSNARDSSGSKGKPSAIRAAMRKAIKQAWKSYAATDK